MTAAARLRPATDADVPRLVAIARRAWVGAFSDAPPEMIAYWRAMDREPGWYARYWPDMSVAEVDGTPVGLVQPAGDEVNGLWIDPDWQGRGLGRRLLREAERQIRSAGHARAWLTCSGFNVRAAGFYRACGYEVEREVVHRHPAGVEETVLTFGRPLASP